MNDTLQAIGQAMRSEAETLRVISQNVANSGTTAYRRQVPVMRAEFDSLVGASLTDASAQLSAAIPRLDIAYDKSAGTLKQTGQLLNLALDGPGFLVVQSKRGLTLTRSGELGISPEGLLSDLRGNPVLGEAGVIQLNSAKPSFGADGSISVDGVVIDHLRIVTLAEDAELTPAGDGQFFVDPSNWQEGDSKASVRQGFLETSNVAPVNEMIQMMETIRRFESEQKAARAFDDMLGKAISELGKTT